MVIKRRTKPRRGNGTKDPAYLDFIRSCDCYACEVRGYRGFSVEAHHLGMSTDRRGIGQKYSDSTAIPVCTAHHREGMFAIHRIGVEAFFNEFGGDRDTVIANYRQRYLGCKDRSDNQRT